MEAVQSPGGWEDWLLQVFTAAVWASKNAAFKVLDSKRKNMQSQQETAWDDASEIYIISTHQVITQILA